VGPKKHGTVLPALFENQMNPKTNVRRHIRTHITMALTAVQQALRTFTHRKVPCAMAVEFNITPYAVKTTATFLVQINLASKGNVHQTLAGNGMTLKEDAI
jgi:hypothetical protein